MGNDVWPVDCRANPGPHSTNVFKATVDVACARVRVLLLHAKVSRRVVLFEVGNKPVPFVAAWRDAVAWVLLWVGERNVPPVDEPFCLRLGLSSLCVIGMCARQHTFHSRGSFLPTREDTDGEPRIPLWNPRLPISVLELRKTKWLGGSR